MFANNDNSAPWQAREVIEQTVAEWLAKRPRALTMPVDDPTLAELATLITERLVNAGLIEPEPAFADA